MRARKLSHFIKTKVCCATASHKGDPDNQNYDDRNGL